MSSSREIRLQKYIADCGLTSRRKAEDLIVAGRVMVNGEVVTQLGTKVDPSDDIVTVDGEVMDANRVEKIYMILNKPRGFVTTLSDPEGRETVMDLVKEVSERIYPVGRLDYLSEGLLILTNDGDVANLIMHPSHEIIKVYEVKIFGAVTEDILKGLRTGVKTEFGFLKPLAVRVIKQLQNKTWLEFRLGEGKNREIRNICEGCGVTIDKLKRVAIGNLTIDDLAPGKYRFFTRKQLLKSIGVNDDGMIIHTQKEYFSNKKSIDVKRKRPRPDATRADEEGFRKFRKESYFETIRELKENKEKLETEKKVKHYQEREEKHHARKVVKKIRSEKKEFNRKPVHAKIIKEKKKKS